MLIENNPYYQTKFGFAYLGDSLQLIDKLYQLTPQQKYFLLAMIQLDVQNFTQWNQIAKYANSRYQISFT